MAEASRPHIYRGEGVRTAPYPEHLGLPGDLASLRGAVEALTAAVKEQGERIAALESDSEYGR